MKPYEFARRNGLLRPVGIVHDLLVAAAALFFSYAIILGVRVTLWVPSIEWKVAGFVAAAGFSFFIFSMNRSSWRYVSVPDLLTILKASIVTVLVYTIGAFLASRGTDVPRSVLVLSVVLLILGLATPRILYRLFLERSLLLPAPMQSKHERRNVLLLGLTDSADSFIRLTRRGGHGDIAVVGVLDEAPRRHARSVQGVRVYGALSDLESVLKRLSRKGIQVSELIVTETAPTRQRLGQVVERTTGLGLRASRIADLTETAKLTSNSILEPREIELGDLLGRPEVVTDTKGVAALINGRTVFVTGAGGSIGSELCRQIALFQPRRMVVTDSSEFHLYTLDMELRDGIAGLPIVSRILDVRDAGRVNRLFEEFKPEIIFHAAALKHVPLVEDNPLEGIKTNLLGTRNVANAALANGASTYVMISTDKAVNPTNVMGATKRAAEAYCQAIDISSEKTRFKTVRFGNVLGSNGSVVPRFREQIAAGGPVTVTHQHIVRYFMTIPEAVRLVLHASAHALRKKAQRGKIMVLDMGEPVRIVHLAERMIQLAGLKPYVDVNIVFTGLRPGEKLYEELFDPSEVQDERTEEGYVIAAPRVIDKVLLAKTIAELEFATAKEDQVRALELLSHIVPEYRADAGAGQAGHEQGQSALGPTILKPAE